MLRLVNVIDVPPPPEFQFDPPLFAFWESIRHRNPFAFWRILRDGDMVMIEYDHATGAVTSIESPAPRTMRRTTTQNWSSALVTLGHPCVVALPPQRPMSLVEDAEIAAFQCAYAATDAKLYWGTETRVVRSGRCMFGFDDESWLVAVGMTDLETSEVAGIELWARP